MSKKKKEQKAPELWFPVPVKESEGHEAYCVWLMDFFQVPNHVREQQMQKIEQHLDAFQAK